MANIPEKRKIPNPEKLDIVFKNIGYKPEGSDTKILEHFNLRIYPNQKVAIVGHSGCGKTTLINQLLKMKSFQEGNIFINGVSISEIDIDDLRKHIVYIPQHPKLFNRTLEENLTYGLPPEITTEDIFIFMRTNGFIELEKIFRKRLHEKVGKTGEKLSGGMRQIVWFLRAIMKKSSLIVADEPTSALDAESRKHIAEMIDYIAKERAIIIITHNLEMTENMERVIVMEKGKIISDTIKDTNNTNNITPLEI
jgi:ABC-type bacteriocin/lantibiotic exporter with double-glycine peptidase domain